MNFKRKWLVQLGATKSGSNFQHYVEVETTQPHQDEYNARHIAIKHFEHQVQYVPSIKKLLTDAGLEFKQIHVIDSVQIEGD